MLKRREFVVLLLAPWLASCQSAGAGKSSLSSGLDLESLDRAVRPQDDLYRFVVGTWLRDTPIPPDRSTYGAFEMLQDQAYTDVRAIAEAAVAGAATAPAGSDAQRIGDLYLSFMDTARIEAVGLEPLRRELTRIGAIDSQEALLVCMGHFQTLAVHAPLEVYVDIDPDRPDRHVAAFWQAGIALPDRVYYLEDTPRHAEYRRRYDAYVADITRLAGIVDDPTDAQVIVALETRLARAHRPREEHRDPGATTNRLSLRDLDALGGVDWRPMLAAAGVDAPEFLVGQPGYVEGVGAAIREVPLAVWRRYLAYELVQAYAPYLASPLAGARFEMFEVTLRGAHEDRPRWKRAVEVLIRTLGDLVGRAYVRQHFPAEDRNRHRGDRDRRRARGADVDGAGHEGGGADQARRPRHQGRLSGALARLHGSADRARRPRRQPAAGGASRARPRGGPPRPARGARGVGDHPSDRERLLRERPQRDCRARRDPTPALLRPGGGGRGELRGDRGGDRPRDQPRLRRKGRQYDAEGRLR